MNTGRDNPQHSFEELMSKGCLLILQNNFLLHELLLLASLSDAAEIVSAPRNRTVLEYDNVTFFCNASSNPPSQIIWTQEGSSTVLHTRETFVIENVSRKLNGQRYKCRTWNNVTKDLEAYAQLTVHCEYSMTLSWKPRITKEISWYTAKTKATSTKRKLLNSGCFSLYMPTSLCKFSILLSTH